MEQPCQWSWAETLSLLAVLGRQPTLAQLVDHYGSIRSMCVYINTPVPDPAASPFNLLALEQRDKVTGDLCQVVHSGLKQLVKDDIDLLMHPEAAVDAVGDVSEALARCVLDWAMLSSEPATVQAKITAHTTELLPTVKAAIVATTKSLKQQQQQPAAAAVDALMFVPDVLGVRFSNALMICWHSLALATTGHLLMPGSRVGGSSSRVKNSRSNAGSSSSSMAPTVLPMCELAVTVLRTWALPAGASSHGSGSRSSGSGNVPAGFFPRNALNAQVFAIADVLQAAVINEVLLGEETLLNSNAAAIKRLSSSQELQHLLLVDLALTGCQVHQQLRGLSPVKATAGAAAAVAPSTAVAAAAAAAEFPAGQQQFVVVTPYHNAVLDILHCPCVDYDWDGQGRRDKKEVHNSIHAITDFILKCISGAAGTRTGTGSGALALPADIVLPLIPLLAELHCLAPEVTSLHKGLLLTTIMQDAYFQAKYEQLQDEQFALSAFASLQRPLLQLLGPAVLHAYKHNKQGDMLLPPGTAGTPVGPGGTPVGTQGLALRETCINMFGTLMVKFVVPNGRTALSAAFREQPLTSAAVLEACLRGAARHGRLSPPYIRLFTTLTAAALPQQLCHTIYAGTGQWHTALPGGMVVRLSVITHHEAHRPGTGGCAEHIMLIMATTCGWQGAGRQDAACGQHTLSTGCSIKVNLSSHIIV